MDIKTHYRQTHTEFPWLSMDDPAGVEESLKDQGLLAAGEAVVSVSKAGEGNMNLTLLVETDRRKLVLKQARPWVEKYDHIAAPWDRILFEQRYYESVTSISGVAERCPEIFGVDAASRTIAMEYLEGATDFIGVYEGGAIESDELSVLAGYLRALHDATRGGFDEVLANRDMRALNHEHIFRIPLADDNGLELDGFEPGLDAAAQRLKADDALQRAVAETGERYLADGECLLHGDYFPGSWLRTPRGIVVIDPEFCYYGDPEFDVGVTVAHLAMAKRPRFDAKNFLDNYGSPLNDELLARYAGIEVIRRLIGVAQLPIPPSADFRVPLLNRAASTVLQGDYQSLWR